MDGNNLLSGSIETLNEMKEALLELQGSQSKYNSSVSEEDKLQKSLQTLEKSISDEITETVKKRRQEIENTFDEQLNKTQVVRKRTENQRGKHKNQRISERILAETASLREENDRFYSDSKLLIKQKHVPGICNTNIFYALYSPGSFGDFGIILLALILTLFIIPCGIYFGLLADTSIGYLIMIYILTVVIFGGIYLMIGNRTKEKYPNEIRQVRKNRNQILENKKEIKKIKKQIRKDKDESAYGLENYDEKLAKLEKETEEIMNQKREALSIFDNSTSPIITAEIEALYKDKRNNLQVEYEKVKEEADQTENRVKALTIKVASEYEPYIGKELMTFEKLDELINIMESGSAKTISEAIVYQKKGKEETGL